MQEEGFWDDMKKSQEVSKELKFLKDRIERYKSIKTRIDDTGVLIEMCREEENEDEAEEILNEVKL